MTTTIQGSSKNESVSQGKLRRHHDFLNLWASQTISQLGNQFSALAIPFTAIFYLNAGATDLGLLRFTGTIAWPMFGLLVGVWVDRHRKQRIMLSSNLLRGFTLILIPIAAVLGSIRQLGLPFLYAIEFTVGFFQVFFDVSYQSFLPSIVPKEQLVEGNSKLEASRATAQLAGPTLAGILIGIITAPLAVATDAISFFGASFAIKRIRQKEELEGPVSRASIRSEMAEGISLVFRDVRLRAIAGSGSTYNFFGSAFLAIILLYFATPSPAGLGLPERLAPVAAGVIFSVGSIGALVGVAIASRMSNRLGIGPVIAGSLLVSGLGFFPFYFSGSLTETPLVTIQGFVINGWVLLILLGEFVASMGLLVHDVNQVSLRQAITPLRLQGRMNASLRWLLWGTIPLGALTGGIIGNYFGLRTAIGISALGVSIAFVWLLPRQVLFIKKMPESLP